MEGAKLSSVWRHFTLAVASSSTAVCNIYRAGVLRGGSRTAKYNMTNSIKHRAKECEELTETKQGIV